MVFSANAMNKIHVGTLCVSRYHQIRKLFSEEDKLKYKDHDFPLGYKIILCGKMPLLKKGVHLHDIFSDIDFQAMDNPVDIYTDENDEDDDYEFDIDGCLKLVTRPTAIAGEDNYSNVNVELSDIIINENELILETQSINDSMVVTEEPVENIDILGSSEDKHEIQSPENRIDDITDAELAIDFITDNGIDETENEVNVGQYSSNDNSQSIHSTPDDSDIYLNEGDTKVDSLGRIHINYPRTGPVLVYNRDGIFHHQTMEGHANDFLPLFKASVSSGKTCIVFIVDNGPDMDPSNYVNEIYWGKHWRDSGADTIQCISYAAGQSAYNPIEHAWSRLSNCLTGVLLPVTLPDEELPPSKQNLSEEEREEKDAAMLDLAAERLVSYWRNATYDGHAVVPPSAF